MKIVQYVTQPSFEQNESNIGENFDDNNTGSITDNNEVVHYNTNANNDDSGSESSSNSPGFTRLKGRVRVNSLSMTVQGNVTT